MAKKRKTTKKVAPKKTSVKPPVKEKVHPWRPCPRGEHWVNGHPKDKISSKGKPFVQNVSGHCRDNPTHKDHLYDHDIQEVASRHFNQFLTRPLKNISRFKGKDSEYDHLIQGWTQYWNEVLKPSEPLDPHVVKALIATESRFDPKIFNHKKGKNAAYGLMQVTVETVQLLKSPKELKDHYIDLTEEDMKNPNLTICAGIRWLFLKKDIADSQLKRKATWREGVEEFKGYRNKKEKKGMHNFDADYADMTGAPLK